MTATASVDVADLARELHAARTARRPVATLTSRWPALDEGDAYAVQARGIALREADGEVLVGGKLGFTSEAMRRAMGVEHPNHGWLTDAMWVDGGVADLARYIHPKVEPEIAFLLADELAAPVSAADVRWATAAVMACLEIVDSRYVGFRFGPLDNIADNSSAGGVVLGDPVAPDTVDLRLAGVVVSVGGVVTSTAAGAAAHGDPAAAVAWMVNTCGRTLPAGAVVISGGLTAPVDLRPGIVVTAEFDRIGPVTVRAT
ncbi:MAG TPA: fumarylacetoacetate hydrolase family protein [Euzebyales bacterium]|nr:fumarylacetoacetate hydrolase family protein [Euzebyales bacterium]